MERACVRRGYSDSQSSVSLVAFRCAFPLLQSARSHNLSDEDDLLRARQVKVCKECKDMLMYERDAARGAE